jgi:hypothetical protein
MTTAQLLATAERRTQIRALRTLGIIGTNQAITAAEMHTYDNLLTQRTHVNSRVTAVRKSDLLSNKRLINFYFSVTLKICISCTFFNKKVQLYFSVRNVQHVTVALFFKLQLYFLSWLINKNFWGNLDVGKPLENMRKQKKLHSQIATVNPITLINVFMPDEPSLQPKVDRIDLSLYLAWGYET